MKKIFIILLLTINPALAEKIEQLSWYNLQELLQDDNLTYKVIKGCVSLNSAVTEIIREEHVLNGTNYEIQIRAKVEKVKIEKKVINKETKLSFLLPKKKPVILDGTNNKKISSNFIIPLKKPVKKKDLMIEFSDNPRVFIIAISLVLFLINIVNPEIILKAATIRININIMNITFLSTFNALKKDLFKSDQE